MQACLSRSVSAVHSSSHCRRSLPPPTQLYHTSGHQEEPTDALDEPPILVSSQKPSAEQRIEALNAAWAAALARERQEKEAARRQKRDG